MEIKNIIIDDTNKDIKAIKNIIKNEKIKSKVEYILLDYTKEKSCDKTKEKIKQLIKSTNFEYRIFIDAFLHHNEPKVYIELIELISFLIENYYNKNLEIYVIILTNYSTKATTDILKQKFNRNFLIISKPFNINTLEIIYRYFGNIYQDNFLEEKDKSVTGEYECFIQMLTCALNKKWKF